MDRGPADRQLFGGVAGIEALDTRPAACRRKVELVRGFRPYLDNQVLDMIHPDVAYSGGITGCKKIADYAALTRTPVGLHSGPCSLIRFYASVHLSGAIQNFFKIENVLGEFRGFKEKMAAGKATGGAQERHAISGWSRPGVGDQRGLAAPALRRRASRGGG